MTLPLLLVSLLLVSPDLSAAAQEQKAAKSADPSSPEDQDLERAIADGGGSPMDTARALERHLKKYPKSERRGEIERVLAQAAVETRDKRRVLLYGVPAIEGGGRNPQLLDHVTRALLDRDDKESLEHALKYSTMLSDLLLDQRKAQLASKEPAPNRGRRLDETEFAAARALTFQARAMGSLGRFEDAVATAARGWALYPTAENAYERARWLDRAAKPKEALGAFAEALTVRDDRAPAADTVKDRALLADLSKKATGSETAFGEYILAAYTRVSAAEIERDKRLREFDPNMSARAVADFTLPGVDGGQLVVSSLKGKVVILDLWATWCGPCRAQHPLYEQVKQRFKNREDVVFLSVNTDDDRSLVKPFLESMKWGTQSWFDDGLAYLLKVSSIPATFVLDRQGSVFSRFNGFIPERFVEQLTDKINEALAEN